MQEKYQSSSCESIDSYGQQGYYPVFLGERFNGAYVVIQKLGWGHFSTVWLVEKKSTNQFFAMKVYRCKQSHIATAEHELKMLGILKEHENNTQWLNYLESVDERYEGRIRIQLCRPLLFYDNFDQFHRYGKHLCTVFELMGPSLRKLQNHYETRERLMPLWLIKKITREILLGLVFLHEHANIIHTDLKPQNIVIKLGKQLTNQLIQNLKEYKVMPISMKFLKKLDSKSRGRKYSENKIKKSQSQPVSFIKENEFSESLQKSSEIDSEQKQGFNNDCQSAKEFSFLKKNESQNVSYSEMMESKNSENVNSERDMDNEKRKMVNKSAKSEGYNQSHDNEDSQIDMNTMTWKNMPININDSLFFKIADFGNSCHINHHFSTQIQTRQYRSPEVILGANYLPNTDVFSLACIVFELMTNTYLFKPKIGKLKSIEEDHLFLIMKTLGPFQDQFTQKCRNYSLYFEGHELLSGNPTKTKSIKQRLQEFGYQSQIAEEVEIFLRPMLQWDPDLRIEAKDCLEDPWLWN